MEHIYIRQILKFLRCALLTIVVIFIALVMLHIFRYFQTPALAGASEGRFKFLSLSEFWESCKKWPTIVSIIVTSVLGFSASFVLGGITKHIKDNKWLTSKLKDATGELVLQATQQIDATNSLISATNDLKLQARQQITDMRDFLDKAKDILIDVRDSSRSYVKLALFWPMLGADFGNTFLTQNWEEIANKPFNDVSENAFYHYLYERLECNKSTDLVFLKYATRKNEKTCVLSSFIDVLSKYKRDHGLNVPYNFSKEIAENLKSKVMSHIKKELVRKNTHNRKVDIRTVDNLPILLLIATQGDKRHGLLFIDNLRMMAQSGHHGGFYTEKPEMIKIFNNLFNSIFLFAKPISNKIKK